MGAANIVNKVKSIVDLILAQPYALSQILAVLVITSLIHAYEAAAFRNSDPPQDSVLGEEGDKSPR